MIRMSLFPLKDKTIFSVVIVESMKPLRGAIIATHPPLKFISHSVLVILLERIENCLCVNLRIVIAPQEYNPAMIVVVLQASYCVDRERHPVPVLSQP